MAALDARPITPICFGAEEGIPSLAFGLTLLPNGHLALLAIDMEAEAPEWKHCSSSENAEVIEVAIVRWCGLSMRVVEAST